MEELWGTEGPLLRFLASAAVLLEAAVAVGVLESDALDAALLADTELEGAEEDVSVSEAAAAPFVGAALEDSSSSADEAVALALTLEDSASPADDAVAVALALAGAILDAAALLVGSALDDAAFSAAELVALGAALAASLPSAADVGASGESDALAELSSPLPSAGDCSEPVGEESS